jgi:hypothetical protein
MYNLNNLNDYEFELLCKDIMQKKLETDLYTYARGRDGGIDIADKGLNPQIIIQVKHYKKYGDLKNTLVKIELAKIKGINIKSYYICTGICLTKANKNEICEIFKDYNIDNSNIISGIDIDDFLQDETNRNIVNKHYKLWLCSTSIILLINNQNIFIDCEELMLDIEDQLKLLVETEAYNKAKEILHKNNIIILTGGPGVGKSTISKMLLLYWANKGYKVRYSSENDVSEMKKVLSRDPEEKEVVLLDDFLGQHYLNIKDSYPNEIKSLISFIERNKNKKLILNTRITIFSEAKQLFINFSQLMQRYDENIYLINLNNMTDCEKAKIFYNHMYFNSISKEYFEDIKKDRRYFNIIKHKNFNPRIIEFITNKFNYSSIPSERYYEYTMQKLNNPEDVWRNEFEKRMQNYDRIFMYVLYSLTDITIDIEKLQKAFNFYIENLSQVDTSINIFNNSFVRLSNSLIKSFEQNGSIKVSVLNPSINDYIKNELKTNSIEQKQIIKYSLYVEQIVKIENSNESKKTIEDMIISGEMFTLNCLKLSINYYYLFFVVKNSIGDTKIYSYARRAFENCYLNVNFYGYSIEREKYSDIISKFIKTYSDAYELNDILLDSTKIYFILKNLILNDLKEIIEYILQKYLDINGYINEEDDIIAVFKELLKNETLRNVEAKYEESDLYDTISKYISDNKYEVELYKEKDSELLLNNIYLKVFEEVKENANSELSSILNINVDLNNNDIENIVSNLYISGEIKNILSQIDDDYNDDDYKVEGTSDINEIINIFERDWY